MFLRELKLSYEKTGIEVIDFKITNPEGSNSAIQPLFDSTRSHTESFVVLFLNRANKVIGHKVISRGGRHGTILDSAIVFQAALLGNASGIILAHNHPSDNLTPSQADLSLTTQIVAAGKVLQITVMDHLIVGAEPGAYYSFADEGKI